MFSRSQWWRYHNGLWTPIHDQEMQHESWQLLEEYERRERMRPTVTILGSVLSCIRARLFVRDELLDSAENLVNLTNGVYNLDDGKLYPHDSKYYMTTQLPFAYDEHAHTSMWQLFLLSTFTKPHSLEHDPELASFVQEAVGYSLTTSVKHHVSFWCYGEGSNGKGVLFHVIEQLAGISAAPLNVSVLRNEQYQLATLAGKRVALCSESESTQNLVSDALIKMLISGDTMQVRQIRREPFTMHPTVKLWWSMNELPPVADTSEGFWRRVKVIPFNRHFETHERILDLKQQLQAELPGIFNWAMAGLKRLEQGAKFTTPKQVIESTENYRREANPLALWIDDCCLINPTNLDQSSALYSSYKDWTHDNNFKVQSSRSFKREMERLGFFWKHTMSGKIYTGLRLK
jgi:putative DNA primase/helicase